MYIVYNTLIFKNLVYELLGDNASRKVNLSAKKKIRVYKCDF